MTKRISRRYHVTLCCLIIVFSVYSQALIESNTTPTPITIGLIIFPPFINQEANEKCSGSAIEDLHIIFPKEQYRLTIYCSSPSRIYRDFNSGKIDITMNIKTTETLTTNIIYSDKSYEELQVCLYTRPATSIKTVSAIRKYSYHGMRNKLQQDGYEFVDFSNTKEAAAVFLREGTDALISYKRPFEYYLQMKNQRGRFQGLYNSYSEQLLTTVPTYFAISKLSKHADELITKINQHYSSNSK